MIQIIVLLEIENQTAFQEFETTAIRIMKKYDGQLLSAFTPCEKESTDYTTNEVHLLQFPDLVAFKCYRADKELESLQELRSRAIRKMTLLVSDKFKNY